MSEDVFKKLKEMATEVCERDGLKLYDVEYSSTSGLVRIYVDADGGVNLDQCAGVSRGMNLLLDVEDPIPGKYNLEVSSPGLERILREKWHYEVQQGKQIKVILKSRTETASEIGKRQFEAVLKDVDDEGVKFEGYESVLVPYEDIHKANLVFDYDHNFKSLKENNKEKTQKD